MKMTVEQLIEEAYHDICTGFPKYGDIIEPETVSTQIKLHKAVEAIHAGKGLNDYVNISDREVKHDTQRT